MTTPTTTIPANIDAMLQMLLALQGGASVDAPAPLDPTLSVAVAQALAMGGYVVGISFTPAPALSDGSTPPPPVGASTAGTYTVRAYPPGTPLPATPAPSPAVATDPLGLALQLAAGFSVILPALDPNVGLPVVDALSARGFTIYIAVVPPVPPATAATFLVRASPAGAPSITGN